MKRIVLPVLAFGLIVVGTVSASTVAKADLPTLPECTISVDTKLQQPPFIIGECQPYDQNGVHLNAIDTRNL